ncbi:MAG TPA: molybdopterin-guanine dinucleotide biosynthesis protein B [Alphaproteobacteria bacterium]|nr:molybdopterin-guanine dinucleotide biosynthesis protein B [Alphaproteobacteria bacterium]
MKIFGFAGWSGSGKTTLVTRLIPELVGRGVRVSTMKHAHHAFDIDKPGKDSYEHRTAGATEVMVTAASRWALMHEMRGEGELSIEELAARMTPVDLLLIEGFKSYPHDKIEVFRASVGKPLICLEETHIVAVASDAPVPKANVPVLDLNDVAAIADFILQRTGLKPARGAA